MSKSPFKATVSKGYIKLTDKNGDTGTFWIKTYKSLPAVINSIMEMFMEKTAIPKENINVQGAITEIFECFLRNSITFSGNTDTDNDDSLMDETKDTRTIIHFPQDDQTDISFL